MLAAKGSARTPLGPIPKIVVTFVYASSQGQRTHSVWTNNLCSYIWCVKTCWTKGTARTPLGPKCSSICGFETTIPHLVIHIWCFETTSINRFLSDAWNYHQYIKFYLMFLNYHHKGSSVLCFETTISNVYISDVLKLHQYMEFYLMFWNSIYCKHVYDV